MTVDALQTPNLAPAAATLPESAGSTRRPARVVMTALALLLLFAGRVCAAMSSQDAVEMFSVWAAKTYPQAQGLEVAQARYANGGYTLTLSGGRPPGLPSLWRIDAQTTEVFADNGSGRFVAPPGAAGQGQQANGAFFARFPGLLPPKARVIEYQPLGPAAPERAVVLWMENPASVAFAQGDLHTCPDYTRGAHWHGPARVSLVDRKASKLLNTLKVQDPLEEADAFDLPWRIPDRAPFSFAYHVPEGAGKTREGRPAILRLLDLTGRGQALDFFLASSGNCMLILYAVFGYSPERDQLLHYQADLAVTQGKKTQHLKTAWLNFWPVTTPTAPGRYHWRVDTTGRGGCLETFDIRFDPASQTFTGALAVTRCQ